MFKKILAVGLSISIILTGTITSMADDAILNKGTGEQPVTVDNIETTNQYGAVSQPENDAEIASTTVTNDVSVDHKLKDGDINVAGASSTATAGKTAEVNIGGDVTVVDTEPLSRTAGIISQASPKYKEESESSAPSSASMNVEGNVSVESGAINTMGIGTFSSNHNSNVSATVKGDLSVSSNATADKTTSTFGVNASTRDGTNTVDIGGSINVNSNNTISAANEDAAGTLGIFVTYTGGTTTVNADGDVNVLSANHAASGTKSSAEGIGAAAYHNDTTINSSAAINVAGDVNVKSTDQTTGACGVDLMNSLGSSQLNVDIDGNVNAEGQIATGISAMTGFLDDENGALSSISVHVGGDVKSSGNGLEITAGDIGTIDVVIEGTLSAKDNAILLSPVYSDTDQTQEDRISITVWKIESGDNTKLAAAGEDHLEAETTVSEKTLAAVEERINYIIRIDEKQTGNITLQGLEKDKNGLYTARAKENVAVKLNIPSGYKLDGAYSDAGHSIQLLRDSTGGYYLVVPSGGGVTVSLALSEIISDGDEGNSGKSHFNNYQNAASIPENALNFNQNNGILSISIPQNMSAFNLDSSVLLKFKAMGLSTLYLDTASGKYTIPISSLDDIVTEGATLTFEFTLRSAYVYVNGTLAREFYPDKAA